MTILATSPAYSGVREINERVMSNYAKLGNFSRYVLHGYLDHLVAENSRLELEISNLQIQKYEPKFNLVWRLETRTDTLGKILRFVARFFSCYRNKLTNLNGIIASLGAKDLEKQDVESRLQSQQRICQKFWTHLETFEHAESTRVDASDLVPLDGASPTPAGFKHLANKHLKDISKVFSEMVRVKSELTRRHTQILEVTPDDDEAIRRLYDPSRSPLKKRMDDLQTELGRLIGSAERLSRACVEENQFGGMETYKQLPLFHMIEQDRRTIGDHYSQEADLRDTLQRFLSRAHTFDATKGSIETTRSLEDPQW